VIAERGLPESDFDPVAAMYDKVMRGVIRRMVEQL
jgi:hypothetical protein